MLSPLKEALQRIEECRQTRADTLDLSQLMLTEIPEEVFELSWLRQLDVSHGKAPNHRKSRGSLRTIPPAIRQLKVLTDLNIAWNCFSDLSYLSHIPQLQSLDCSVNQLCDLSGLEHMPQLQSLDCSVNQLCDLSVLEHMPQLQSLDCSNNQLLNMNGLEYAPQLQSLSCNGNTHNYPIDLNSLKHVRHLQSLSCSHNRLIDLNDLEYTPQLQALYCSSNQLHDLSSLEHVPQLESLDCGHNQLLDLQGLEHTRQLQSLSCDSNQLRNLSGLEHTPQLQALSCSANQLDNLSSLEHNPQLESLDCSFNPLKHLSDLQHVPKLDSLSCNGNQLIDLTILEYVPQLQSLYCLRNSLNDLNGLEYVPQLQLLGCGYNQLNDLSELVHTPQLQLLYCGNNPLNDLSGLAHVPQLQALYCGSSQLLDLGSLKYVRQLQLLTCYSNQLNNLNDLKHVPQLQLLECGDNPLNDLSGLAHVPQLRELNCSFSPLSNLSGLVYVPQLDLLDCSYTQVDDLSGLEYVPQLQSLDCSNNQLKNIEPLHDCVLSGQLKHLQLYGNQIRGIPEILFGNDQYDDCLRNLCNYWSAIDRGFFDKNQLKVQFIGNGRVGKTTLAYALEYKKGPSENFKPTHGITIKEIPHIAAPGQDPITLQLWDFGGQEIYHATHRLFLGDDCLYLLLWAEDTGEHNAEIRHPASYWLDLIRDLAPKSSVILVKNQIDQSDNHSDTPPDLELLPTTNEQIKAKVKISALQYWGIADSLSGAINYLLRQLQHRIWLRLPQSWMDIETTLKELKSRKTIPFAHFAQLCVRAGIDDPEWFVDYLHKTGVLFFHRKAFQNQIILDQSWAIEAVYHLFDPDKRFRQQIKSRSGRFDSYDLEVFWPDIDAVERDVYLEFMQGCGICYQPASKAQPMNTQDGEHSFILPALLPETPPATAFWPEVAEQGWLYRVNYPFLHRGIKEHLIGHLGKYSNVSVPWLEGIRCAFPHGEVLLECKYEDSELSRKGTLHFQLRSKQPDKLLYGMRKLVREVSPHNQFIESLHKAGEQISLEDFKEQQEAEQEQNIMPKKVKLFISYAHEDEDYRKELDKRLRGIQRKSSLVFWHDRDLLAGEQVHDTILQQLEIADIVVLLISPDFIASDYCFTHEMEVALKQYEEKKNIVIPVIIRETEDWHGFKIGNHVALPADGKPLCDWEHEDKFWSDVQKGIRKQVEKHIAP